MRALQCLDSVLKMIDIDYAINLMQNNDNKSLLKVSLLNLEQWARDDNISNLGKLYYFMSTTTCTKFSEDKLFADVSSTFLQNYYLRCIKENPDDEWADSRYTAAWDCAGWFMKLHAENKLKILNDFTERLSVLYKSSDYKTKEAVINGFLEHVLRKKSTHRYFRGWKRDQTLFKALSCGIDPSLPLDQVI